MLSPCMIKRVAGQGSDELQVCRAHRGAGKGSDALRACKIKRGGREGSGTVCCVLKLKAVFQAKPPAAKAVFQGQGWRSHG
jgi:hypothetical protein